MAPLPFALLEPTSQCRVSAWGWPGDQILPAWVRAFVVPMVRRTRAEVIRPARSLVLLTNEMSAWF
jgi:hypothetical protein